MKPDQKDKPLTRQEMADSVRQYLHNRLGVDWDEIDCRLLWENLWCRYRVNITRQIGGGVYARKQIVESYFLIARVNRCGVEIIGAHPELRAS